MNLFLKIIEILSIPTMAAGFFRVILITCSTFFLLSAEELAILDDSKNPPPMRLSKEKVLANDTLKLSELFRLYHLSSERERKQNDLSGYISLTPLTENLKYDEGLFKNDTYSLKEVVHVLFTNSEVYITYKNNIAFILPINLALNLNAVDWPDRYDSGMAIPYLELIESPLDMLIVKTNNQTEEISKILNRKWNDKL